MQIWDARVRAEQNHASNSIRACQAFQAARRLVDQHEVSVSISHNSQQHTDTPIKSPRMPGQELHNKSSAFGLAMRQQIPATLTVILPA